MLNNFINWREIPFVRLFIPLAMGIVVFDFWQPTTSLVGNVLLLLSTLCILFLFFKKTEFRQRWLFGIPLSIFLFSLGFQIVFYHNEKNNSNHFENILVENNENLIIGTVTDLVEKATNLRLTIAVQNMGNSADSMQKVSGNLLLYLKKDSTHISPEASEYGHPQYGDLVLVAGRIREVESPKNPDAFDFKNYLHHQNIHFQSFIRADNIQILAHYRGNPIMQTIMDWQAQLIKILKEYLPTEREFAVGSALILGYRDAVTDEVRNAYVETGSMHILAVSGMHIMLIFTAFEWFLSFYKTGNRTWRWTKTGISIVLIWLFTLLTGAGASVVRAAVMATFLALGKGWGRQTNVYNVLASSAFVLLLWNPYWLFDVGFQLSYFAVIGIVYFQPKIYQLWVVKNKVGRWVWQSTAVGLAAQLVVTPISLYYFHQFPTYFWLSGLLAVPVSTGALYAGTVSFFTYKILFIGWGFGKILFGFVWLMNEIVFFIQKLPLSILKGFWLSTFAVFLIYAIIIGVAIALKTKRLRTLTYPLSVLCLLSLLYSFYDMKAIQQKEIIVYHIHQNTVIDFMDGQKCYTISKEFSQKSDSLNRIKFAVENHRMNMKINMLEDFSFEDTVHFQNIIYQSNVSQFHDFRLAILDKSPEKGVILHVNAILLHQNARIHISELLQSFRFDTVIFDGSNAPWRVEKWKKECLDLGITFHDTAEKGAWVKKF